ncbi:MAG TPA: hypothetical protein VKD22_06955 [Ramlibacter sp.]|nr:hypothetical protein [Ramlibacter sp.]
MRPLHQYMVAGLAVAFVAMAAMIVAARFVEIWREQSDFTYDHRAASGLDCPRLLNMDFESDVVRRSVQETCWEAKTKMDDSALVSSVLAFAQELEDTLHISFRWLSGMLSPLLIIAGLASLILVVRMFTSNGASVMLFTPMPSYQPAIDERKYV